LWLVSADGPPRPIRFLCVPELESSNVKDLITAARRIESIGYSALVTPDHLISQPAPIPVLAAVAASTERLRIGTFVFNAALRHPAVLAQDLGTLDQLSDGRLEIGIGAGWNRPEFDAIGLPFHPAARRIEVLREAIAVLKGCFAEGPFSFTGTHFTLTDHDGHPKPAQRPHPPFMVGGGGRRLLALAAQEADIVGFAPRLITDDEGAPRPEPHSLTLAALEEKLQWVRAAAGDRFAHLEFNTYPANGRVFVTNNVRAVAQERIDRIRELTGVELTVDDIVESPHMFIGSAQGLIDKFLHLRERFGISSFTLTDAEAVAPIVEALAGRLSPTDLGRLGALCDPLDFVLPGACGS
jgi:probable F420-dependent oxidoreductase